MILHAQYVFKSLLIPHLVINSMGCLAEIPCQNSLHQPSVSARSFQIFCHLIHCPNSSHFYSQASFHFHRILYLPWEEENITKTIQCYIFWNQNKIEELLTTNSICNGLMILLLLRMRIHQHQRMFTEGEVFRDCLVLCFPLSDKETEAQKVRGLPEAPQTDVVEQGDNCSAADSYQCLCQAPNQGSSMISDFPYPSPKCSLSVTTWAGK